MPAPCLYSIALGALVFQAPRDACVVPVTHNLSTADRDAISRIATVFRARSRCAQPVSPAAFGDVEGD